MWYVYALSDPRSNEIRYVGITNDLNKRLLKHCSRSMLKSNTYKNNWIKELLSENLVPVISVLCEFDDRQAASKCEIDMILNFRKNGARLTNMTKGGYGKPEHLEIRETTREKLSKAHKGKVVSEKTKIKMSEKRRLRTKQPMSGKTHSRETKIHLIAKQNVDKKSTMIVDSSYEPAINRKLTIDQACQIRSMYDEGIYSTRDLANYFGVSRKTIINIIRCITYKL